MAKTNGKNGSIRNKDRILHTLGDAHSRLYSLETLGEAAERMPIDLSTFNDTVEGLCDRARKVFAEVSTTLPEGHAARDFLKKASAALDVLEGFAWMAYQGPEGDQRKVSVSTRRILGRGILAFTGEAGRWMERAELAIDPTHIACGYLQDGYLIAGGEGMTLPRENKAEKVADAARRFAQEVSAHA